MTDPVRVKQDSAAGLDSFPPSRPRSDGTGRAIARGGAGGADSDKGSMAEAEATRTAEAGGGAGLRGWRSWAGRPPVVNRNLRVGESRERERGEGEERREVDREKQKVLIDCDVAG